MQGMRLLVGQHNKRSDQADHCDNDGKKHNIAEPIVRLHASEAIGGSTRFMLSALNFGKDLQRGLEPASVKAATGFTRPLPIGASRKGFRRLSATEPPLQPFPLDALTLSGPTVR
jgi:hypothetical protein